MYCHYHAERVLSVLTAIVVSAVLDAPSPGQTIATSWANTAMVQDDNEAEKLPSITYGNSRESTGWVKTQRGNTTVAIDKGIEYDGVKYYLALTWHLVAVDSATGRTIWSKDVSAYWNQLAIEKIRRHQAEESQIAVVALRTGRDDESKDRAVYFDLKSGKKIDDPNAESEPKGQKINPAKAFRGNECGQSTPLFQLVTSQQRWREIYDEVFAEPESAPDREGLFDDTDQVAVVIFSGDTTNCSGISPAAVYLQPERILIRLHYHTYQSGIDTPTVQPYGVFVLPRHADKPYVFQRNTQRYIGGPAIWEDYKTLEIDEP